MKDQNSQQTIEAIKSLDFCVFDLETTGGNLKNDKIIEIGLVKIHNLEIVDKKTYLIQPQMRIPDFIQKLTNIKQADVEGAPIIEDVIDDILSFMDNSILVAHNTSFDVPFFNSVLKRLGKEPLDNKSLCTNLMTKYLIPNLLNSNLNYMAKIFQIKHSKAHRALDDANATAELLINYLKIFISKDIQKINHLYYPRNRYELDRIHFKSGKHSNEEVVSQISKLKTPSLFTLKGENGVILFSFPCSNDKRELELIEQKLEKLNWETATIKLYGTFLQSFVNFNTLFTKIMPHERSEIIKTLWQHHFNKQPPQNEDQVDASSTSSDFGDFVICKHLVPEQYIILPLQALHNKSQLVFRYPGHKKKLLQFIRSKSNRLTNNKLRKASFHFLLQQFINAYLSQKKELEKEVFIFEKNLPLKFENDFFKLLEEYLTKNPSSYQYPREYI